MSGIGVDPFGNQIDVNEAVFVNLADGVTQAKDGLLSAATIGSNLVYSFPTLSVEPSPTFTNLTINGTLTTPLSNNLASLTTAEISQLLNINTRTISNSQWGYLSNADQQINTTASPAFSYIDITNDAYIGGILTYGTLTGGTINANQYNLAGNAVLSGSTLGSTITASSLTSVGILNGLVVSNNVYPSVTDSLFCGIPGNRWDQVTSRIIAAQIVGQTSSGGSVGTLANPWDEVFASTYRGNGTTLQLAPSSSGTTLLLSSSSFDPNSTNSVSLGLTSLRWSNVYSVLGNFSGLLTASAGLTLTGTLTTSNSNNLASLTTAEISQLLNIDANVITNTQWGYISAMNQGITTTSNVTFASVTVGNSGNVRPATSGMADLGTSSFLFGNTYTSAINFCSQISSNGDQITINGSKTSPTLSIGSFGSTSGTSTLQFDGTTAALQKISFSDNIIDRGLISYNHSTDILTITSASSIIFNGTLTTANSNNLASLTTAEISQLLNINATAITTTQWGYLGAMNQGVTTTSNVTHANMTATNYLIGANTVLSGSTLGASITASSLQTFGNVTALNMNGNIAPTANNTRECGTAALRWANINSTLLNISSTATMAAINASGALTMSANILASGVGREIGSSSNRFSTIWSDNLSCPNIQTNADNSGNIGVSSQTYANIYSTNAAISNLQPRVNNTGTVGVSGTRYANGYINILYAPSINPIAASISEFGLGAAGTSTTLKLVGSSTSTQKINFINALDVEKGAISYDQSTNELRMTTNGQACFGLNTDGRLAFGRAVNYNSTYLVTMDSNEDRPVLYCTRTTATGTDILMRLQAPTQSATAAVSVDCNGDIRYRGTLIDVSDRRIKRNITEYTNDNLEDIEVIADMFKHYELRYEEPGRPLLGLIAQDLEVEFPALVRDSLDEPTRDPENPEAPETPLKAVAYEIIYRKTTKAVGSLIKEFRALKNRIITLEAKNIDLETRIEDLEALQS